MSLMHSSNIVFEMLQGGTDQNGIVNRGADFDSVLDSQTTSQSQHFGAVGLHVKIAQRARIGPWRNSINPAKSGPLPTAENGMVHGVIGPLPELGRSLWHCAGAARHRRLIDPQANVEPPFRIAFYMHCLRVPLNRMTFLGHPLGQLRLF